MGYYLLPKRGCYGNWRIRSIGYIRFESFSAAQNSSVSRDSSVGVDRLLEADNVETFWRRSYVTRATKESKDVEVPRRFQNRVAVSWRRSSIGWQRCWIRPSFLLLLRRERRIDEELKRRWYAVRRHVWLRQETDGLLTAGRMVVARGKCDVIVTDCIM